MASKRQVGLWVGVGFITGVGVTVATMSAMAQDTAMHELHVSIDEVRQHLVSADEVGRSYTHTVQLSDGTHRTITLTPVEHDGMPLVALRDQDDHGRVINESYMGPNATAVDDPVSIHVQDVTEARAMMKAARERRQAAQQQ